MDGAVARLADEAHPAWGFLPCGQCAPSHALDAHSTWAVVHWARHWGMPCSAGILGAEILSVAHWRLLCRRVQRMGDRSRGTPGGASLNRAPSGAGGSATNTIRGKHSPASKH